MMIAGDATHAMLQRFLFPHVHLPLWATTRWASVMLPSIFVILPLSLLRNIGALAPTSSLAVAAMTFTSGAIVFKLVMAAVQGDIQIGELNMQDVQYWNISPSMLNAIPIMVFAYQCHVQAVPIYAELTGSPSLFPRKPEEPSLQKKCRGMSVVAAVAFLQCTVMYIATGAAGYIQFPLKTDSNILSNYDIHDDLMQIARILVGGAATLHYPVDLHAARTALYDLACKYSGQTPQYPPPYLPIAAAAASMWCLTAVLACILTDLGKVFQVIGGIAGSIVIFVLPGAILAFDPVGFDPSAPERRIDTYGTSAEAEVLVDSVELPGESVDARLTCAQEDAEACIGQGSLDAPVARSEDSSYFWRQRGSASGFRFKSSKIWGFVYMSIGSLRIILTVGLTVMGTPG